MSTTYAVIMAGGAGTRFWPASRNLRPKQLLPLAGDPDESLLRATVRRLSPLIPAERVYVVTAERLVEATRKEVPNVPSEQVLAEPVPRNTAPCIGWASATIARRDPAAILAVLPADHAMGDEPGFRATLERAIAAARTGRITTIGIVPTRPETGYGYLEIGDGGEAGLREVLRFVEKPDKARAEGYVKGGRHLWNAGMFFFPVAKMKDAIRRHLPALDLGLTALDAAAARGDEGAALRELFPQMPAVSIDVGVMEKESGLAVVPGDFGWNDVGSWESAWELAAKDPHGNAGAASAVFVDAERNLVRDLGRQGGKVIALVGVSDLVVVETDDAILVIPRERAQDVRSVVEALKARGQTDKL